MSKEEKSRRAIVAFLAFLSCVLGTGVASAVQVTLSECDTVPATPAIGLLCVSNSTTGIEECIGTPPVPGCQVCTSVSCSADGSVVVNEGASNFEPPPCLLSKTINTAGAGSCSVGVTTTCAPPLGMLGPVPVPSVPLPVVVPLGPLADETQICILPGAGSGPPL